MEEKLYSPLNFFLRDSSSEFNGEYDDHHWRDEITHKDAFTNMAEIEEFLSDDRKTYDAARGLMEYYGDGPLDDKVRSLFPHVELHGDQLWMVAHLQLEEPLTPMEMADLKSWWGGQLSDGWGEGLEQRDITVVEGDLYIEPWTSSAGFFIATQSEFDRRMGIEEPAPDLDSMKKALFQRLDSNLSDYCMSLLGTDKDELIGMSEEIATRFSVRDYLKKDHRFDVEELDFLLGFDNPLEIVANHTPPPKMLLTMADALHNLIAIEDALNDPKRRPEYPAAAVVSQARQAQASRDELLAGIAKEHCFFETLETRKSDSLDFREVSVWGLKDALEAAFAAGAAYQREQLHVVSDEFVPEPEAPAVDEQALRDTLAARLEQNYAETMNDYRSDISAVQLSTKDFVELADRISIVSDAYEYLMDDALPLDQVEYLLNFKEPLEVVADRWPENYCTSEEKSRVVWDICDRQDALQGDYSLAESNATPATPAASGKRSLLAEVRQAQARIAEKDSGKDREKQHADMDGPEL